MKPSRLFIMLLLYGGFSLFTLSQPVKDDRMADDSVKTNVAIADSVKTNVAIADSVLADSNNTISAADYTVIKKKVDEIIEFRDEEEFEQLVKEGIELFNGTTRLENKGASCISCHILHFPGISRGGFLGADLTDSYANVNKEKGLQLIFNTPTAPAMKTAFANNPFTHEETRRLVALLKKADEEKALHLSSVNRTFMLIYGIAGFFAILLVMLIIWNKRIKRSVKHDIYSRQIKTV